MPEQAPLPERAACWATELDPIMAAVEAVTPELDATGLAEVLWLASRMASADSGAEHGAANSEPAPVTDLPQSPPLAAAAPDLNDVGLRGGSTPVDREAHPLHERLPGSTGRVPGRAVAVRGATALPAALEITRALRPWKRAWRNGRRSAINLDATVDAYARSGELIPMFEPAPERWFDLVLVVDRSPSMQVWQQAADAFAGVLDRLGAFRTLQVHDLRLDAESGVELTDRQGRPKSPGQLGSADGRRLVVVVSDCTAAAWREPEVWMQLRTWAERESVALLNPLPPKLWRRTGLDLPTVRAASDAPGASNARLAFQAPSLLARSTEEARQHAWLALPVLSFSPHSLGRWSRAVMLAAPDGCSTALIPSGGRLAPLGVAQPVRPRSPEERTDGFLRTAAPAAAKLAVLSSTVDRLSLGLLHLLRQELVPEATTEDLGELLASGLYELSTDSGNSVVLQAPPQVREHLEQMLTRHEVVQLSRVWGRHVSSGRASGRWLPLVAGGTPGAEELAAEATPAGVAWARTLQLLGLPMLPANAGGTSPRTEVGSPLETLEQAMRLALALLPREPKEIIDELGLVVNSVAAVFAEQGRRLDPSVLLKQLEAHVTQFVPSSAAVLSDASDHVPWSPSRESARGFWNRYHRLLAAQAWRPDGINQLDENTDVLLSELEDPQRSGAWNRSGLWVAPIDWGRTAMAISLAAKAIDAGYLTVIIIAGTTNLERATMQLRFEEGLLGFSTQLEGAEEDLRYLGVGAFPDSPRHNIVTFTTSAEDGDFKGFRALSTKPRGLPELYVVKRNRRILSNLHAWLRSRMPSGRPLLVIDIIGGSMQAGKASSVMEEQVRDLLSVSTRTAHVSFGEVVPMSGASGVIPDFIYSSSTLSDQSGTELSAPIRIVDDQEPWMPAGHRADHVPSRALPASMLSAIDAFVLACAARAARGQGRGHNTMLVSVSRFVAVQAHVRDQLAERFHAIARGLRDLRSVEAQGLISRFERVWHADFIPTSAQFPGMGTHSTSWQDVSKHLPAVAQEIIVSGVGGRSNDLLELQTLQPRGPSIVIVRGDKAAKGTALDGLTVSYHTRFSASVDALRQLNLSFLSRSGYGDLCRLYATEQVLEGRESVTSIIEEQHRGLREMAEMGITPRQAMPSLLAPERALQVAVADQFSQRKRTSDLSGRTCETNRLTLNPEALLGNLAALKNFVGRLGVQAASPPDRDTGSFLWRDVSPEEVLDFFDRYQLDPQQDRGRRPLISEYVRDCIAYGELLKWTVQLISPPAAKQKVDVGGHRIGLVLRRPVAPGKAHVLEIRRLSSPAAECADLTQSQYESALAATRAAASRLPIRADDARTPSRPSRAAVNAVRQPDHALLTIYLIQHPAEVVGIEQPPVVGFAVSFPASASKGPGNSLDQ